MCVLLLLFALLSIVSIFLSGFATSSYFKLLIWDVGKFPKAMVFLGMLFLASAGASLSVNCLPITATSTLGFSSEFLRAFQGEGVAELFDVGVSALSLVVLILTMGGLFWECSDFSSSESSSV